MMLYLQLFLEFFKTGLLAVGGGMATVPFLMDMGSRMGWFTASALADMIAISESTPGPIGVNMATYVGFSTGGILGGLVSTLGLVAPSLIIIIIIARFLSSFSEKPVVKTVFRYLRPAVIGLIGYALWSVAKMTVLDGSRLLVLPSIGFVVIFALMRVFKKVHPIVWIAAGAVFGIVLL